MKVKKAETRRSSIPGTKKRILVLSRKYPPSIGGMQYYSKHFIEHLSDVYDVDKITLGMGQGHLIWFLPYLFLRSCILLVRKKYDLVYLCDSLLSPVGYVLKKMFKIKVFVCAHGLDITYNRFFYQKIIPRFASMLDRVICVSNNTKSECMKRGISGGRCVVIHNGVEKGEYPELSGLKERATELSSVTGHNISGRTVLATVGRLVKRKGVEWFIKNVMTRLDGEYIYIIVGEGPEKDRISKTILDHKDDIDGDIIMMGRIDDKTLRLVYAASDIMVLPNQKVPDDVEGFGIVAIEAAICGTPVIANRVDALEESVLEGKTGYLIDYNDAGAFCKAIENICLVREDVRFNAEAFDWGNVIKQYEREINENI